MLQFVENNQELKARIKVIGVGGGGGNALNNMIESRLRNVEFICANTDSQALKTSLASTRIQLGGEVTHGLAGVVVTGVQPKNKIGPGLRRIGMLGFHIGQRQTLLGPGHTGPFNNQHAVRGGRCVGHGGDGGHSAAQIVQVGPVIHQ